MTAGTPEPVSIAQYQETCPTCKGTGRHPEADQVRSPGFGQSRAIHSWPMTCPNSRCKDGFVPNAEGLSLLKFFQVFKDVPAY